MEGHIYTQIHTFGTFVFSSPNSFILFFFFFLNKKRASGNNVRQLMPLAVRRIWTWHHPLDKEVAESRFSLYSIDHIFFISRFSCTEGELKPYLQAKLLIGRLWTYLCCLLYVLAIIYKPLVLQENSAPVFQSAYCTWCCSDG